MLVFGQITTVASESVLAGAAGWGPWPLCSVHAPHGRPAPRLLCNGVSAVGHCGGL